MKDQYKEHYQTLQREIKEKLNSGVYYAHELDNIILS